ncbi:MAG: ADP-ribosylglycohydrolase family protein [Bryobacteraceae bacterium]|nr:ADP-ribosylglycohydrolase family protein [Bryobacteraceae bacterium]MDW8376724.1 ADP-ribosylglycohydrolase family protein [Bryobacterales bacterium]
MNHPLRLASVFLLAVLLPRLDAQRLEKISLAELRDRIQGGWAGQMIGVSYGAPTEFRYREQIIPKDQLPKWTPDRIRNALNQDDLYVDMTLAKVLDEKGLEATTEDFGAMFRQAKYALWHANLAARRALRRGVPAHLTGTPKYNVHAEDIDFQIEADFIGLMTPGLPQLSNRIAERAGRVMNYADGLYGGMFVSCMYAEAFFAKDPEKVVRAGLACLPAKSRYYQVISDVIAWARTNPDWETTWRLIEQKWNKEEPCPEGALQPFNIDAALNGAYIVLGLLYGKGQWEPTLEIATRAGQDSDCNPASAMGILGTMIGLSQIPEIWKAGLPAIENEKFRYTDFTFASIVESTLRRALAAIELTGGRRDKDAVWIQRQKAKPAKYEVFIHGSPQQRIPASDSRWKYVGEWSSPAQPGRQSSYPVQISSQKGAQASISFTGTGVIVSTNFLPTCGKADVYLNGRLDTTVDCYPDEDSPKYGESLWHAFGLPKREHHLRIVVRGEPVFDSRGTEVAITGLIVFH